MVYKIFLVPSLCDDIATLLSIEIVAFIRVFFVWKYGRSSHPKKKLNVLWDTHVLARTFFYVKDPNNNLSMKRIFLKCPHTNAKSHCILSKHMLKIKAFSYSPLNACIPSTCCIIMWKHYYKANATWSSLFSQDDSSCSFFLTHQCKTEKDNRKRDNECM